ncbi:MAG TPA: dihydrolipoamide acetyltransferase family protein [Acidimicrobiia bacterium]|jgi:pyruvate dehydrogenase E2 component (dihydrolipoamide acetyltransferase)|nr:dihydrolipoamide acetyltransferase family protein [Acidimicrobiia bacterium]
MATEFHLPDIGEGLTEAVIVEWHVAVGETVSMDAPLVEVETDKAVVDIPSPVAGVLLHQGGAEGDTIEVEALLAVVGEAGETWTPRSAAPAGEVASAAAAPIVGSIDHSVEVVTTPAERVRLLPMLRRLADELGVDVERIAGTGPGGRITEDDIRNAVATSDMGPVRRERMSAVRRTIARRLAQSWREIPHVTVYDEADAAAVLAERASLGKPPLEALLVKRLLPLLVEYPEFNATLQGDEIVHKLHYDIGIAVDTPEGLMVTVVRDAGERGVAELSSEISRLAAAARNRTATPDELRGQTFTISNIGAVGGRYGTPIIPLGTTAILSVGRAVPRPVVREGEIVVATEMPLSLSYDHRVIDGGTGRAFLGALVRAFEAPATA